MSKTANTATVSNKVKRTVKATVAAVPTTATESKRVKADASIENAARTAQPGVIGTIMHLLCDARDSKQPTTTKAMLAELSKTFADRPAAGLQITLRAQLSRLPNERKFAIDKQRDGVTVYYSAAKTAKRNAPKVAAA